MYDLYKKSDYRQIITLKRPGNVSNDGFKEWWFERADKIKNIPGIKWYTINFTLDCSPFGKPSFDGFEEIWFGSVNELIMAYEHEIMRNSFKDIKQNGFDRPELMQAAWLEENIVTLKGYSKIPDRKDMVRLTGICSQPPNMSRKDLIDWFYQHAARVIDSNGRMIIPGIRWYTHSFSIYSPFGKSRIDGCAENWWETLAEIKEDFNGEIMQSQLEDREKAIDVIDPSYFQGVWAEEFVIKIPK
ncbi:MAG: hypothetical protein M1308_22990 [Actinobacteria bacterium]|nr:hypothetical protein [Actinomycetota bacterium]